MVTKIERAEGFTELAAVNRESGRKIAEALFWGIIGALITDMRIGGGNAPFGAAVAAALSPLSSAAAVLGMFIVYIASYSLWENIAELAAAVVAAVFSAVFGKKCRTRARALAAGAAYFISSAAVCAGNGFDPVMFIAVFFRAVMCGGAAYCLTEALSGVKKGVSPSQNGDLQTACIGITYILGICLLCSPDMGLINLGRIAAGFCTAAAARKFGKTGGTAAGILSASAFLLSEQTLGRSGAMLAFTGLVTGLYSYKGKYAVNLAFIVSAFGISAAAGMPSGTPEFIIDTGIAAALYCLIPERLYLTRLGGLFVSDEDSDIRSDKLDFAARILEEVGDDAQTAAELFMRTGTNTEDPCESVRKSVCGAVCTQHKCSAACGGISPDGVGACFKAAQSIAEKKGGITAKELPAGFEGCPKKAQIADGFCRAAGIDRLLQRKNAYLRRFLDSTSEQLSASCGVLTGISEGIGSGVSGDRELSRLLGRFLDEEGFSVRSACVYRDSSRRPFGEAFINASEDFRDTHLSGVTERLEALLGVRLASPVTMVCGGEERICRIRWRAEGRYVPDFSASSEAAEGSVCGDSYVCFEDGIGGFYIIISDGMGRGSRAGSRSALAVNLLRRMICGGTGRRSAVQLLNVIMSAASADEIFTTADIFYADLYTGEGRLIKMGAAPTAVLTRDEDDVPVISIYSDCSAPVGIISGISVTEERLCLDERSRVLMVTDGIDITNAATAAVLENDRLTCGQMCSRIIAAAEDCVTERPDDRTAAVFRLYKA